MPAATPVEALFPDAVWRSIATWSHCGLLGDKMTEPGIGFIGAGRMATALASGFAQAGLADAAGVWASDPIEAARQRFADAVPGAQTTADNCQVLRAAATIVLAVKPQQLAEALTELRPVSGPQHLVISICAGVPLAHLAAGLGDGVRLVRVMPNTPCLVGQSASGYCLGPNATESDREHVGKLLSAVGKAYLLREPLLDAVTGLAGSGPAYVYLIIEALSDGGVLMGLPRDVATSLAVQTVRGAAEMVQQRGTHPAVLKEEVTSPGGTTIAALQALDAAGVRAAMMAAVQTATRR
jgi:pyrroline-5-carboxylate reductase